MPRHATVSVPAKTWTELTSGDVTNITFENLEPGQLFIQATTGAAPADLEGALKYTAVQGEINAALSEVFPGVSGAVRVWVWSKIGTRVAVSHA